MGHCSYDRGGFQGRESGFITTSISDDVKPSPGA